MFHIITDSTPDSELEPPPGMETGLDLTRPRGETVYDGVADPFPQELIIPKADWQGWIEEQKSRQTRLYDRMRAEKLPAKNQKNIPYCWVFAPTHCVEIVRFKHGLGYQSLSPASAGAQVKNFRAVGGWGREALQFIANHGLVPSYHWPDTAISRQYLTEENKQIALDYRVTEWWVLRTVDEYISALLRGFPVACGYDWWAHETTGVSADWLDGAICTINRNQWAGYGDDNYFHLQGKRMVPDDAVCARLTVAA